jgi:hypothetical protein
MHRSTRPGRGVLVTVGLALAVAATSSAFAVPGDRCAPQGACAEGGRLDRVASSAWGRGHFGAACEKLDGCYATTGASKRACDDDFGARLLEACDHAYAHHTESAPAMEGYLACASLAERYRLAAAADESDRAFGGAQACVTGVTVEQQPSALAPERPVQVVVRAKDSRTGAEVGAEVQIDGRKVGEAGRAFELTPHLLRLTEGTHRFFEEPTLSVVAGGRTLATRMLDVKRPAMVVRLMPSLESLPPGSHALVVGAVDADTHRPVQGTVTMRGAPVGHTNVPFSYTQPGENAGAIAMANMQPGEVVDAAHCPDLWIVADGYADTPAGGNDCLR